MSAARTLLCLVLLAPGVAWARPPVGPPLPEPVLPANTATVLGAATYDGAARTPLAVGGEVRANLHDLDLRARLLHTRMPPGEVEDFILANIFNDEPAPDKIAWSRWEARMAASWNYQTRSLHSGPRVRVGLQGIVSGSAGAGKALEPIGWNSDYTAALQLGPTAAVGWAMPLADDPFEAFLDIRLGGSVAQPVSAGGGWLADPDERDWLLTVDDRTFGSASLIGVETRGWVEGTLTLRNVVIGVEAGLEHNARSALRRARVDSPDWDVEDVPERVDPHLAIQVGYRF